MGNFLRTHILMILSALLCLDLALGVVTRYTQTHQSVAINDNARFVFQACASRRLSMNNVESYYRRRAAAETAAELKGYTTKAAWHELAQLDLEYAKAVHANFPASCGPVPNPPGDLHFVTPAPRQVSILELIGFLRH